MFRYNKVNSKLIASCFIAKSGELKYRNYDTKEEKRIEDVISSESNC